MWASIHFSECCDLTASAYAIRSVVVRCRILLAPNPLVATKVLKNTCMAPSRGAPSTLVGGGFLGWRIGGLADGGFWQIGNPPSGQSANPQSAIREEKLRGCQSKQRGPNNKDGDLLSGRAGSLPSALQTSSCRPARPGKTLP